MINSLLNGLSIKLVRTVLICGLFLCQSAMSNELDSYVDLNKYVGLYQIVAADCDIPKGAFNPCENTRFFEIVKGQFIGIKDAELAYVFWSGNHKIDSELQYSAQLISNHKLKKVADDKLWLNNNSDTQEYLVISNGVLQEYYAKYGAADKGKERIIKYQLLPVRRGNLPLYRMNYPGNK